MNLGSRRFRLRAVWLLVLPFLWWARPTPGSLLLGAGVALVGLAIRGWAAGVLHKLRELTVSGPYAFTRNPLYLGSFFLGLGLAVAGGVWVFVALFVLFYVVVYGKTMGREATLLEERFGAAYRAYAARVPLLVPRLTPYRPAEATGPPGFTFRRYLGHREYEALLGAVLGFLCLWGKMWIGLGGS